MPQAFSVIWEFEILPGREDEFRQHYAPGGTWEMLFRHDPAYIQTLLLADMSQSGRYVTVDRWESAEAYRTFRRRYAQEYAEIDRRCEGLTRRETDLGAFLEMTGAGPFA